MKMQGTTQENDSNSYGDYSPDTWNDEDLKSPMLLGLSSFLIQDYVDRIINTQTELAALEQATYASI